MDPDNKQSQVPVQTPPIVQTPPPPVQTTPPIQAPPPVIPPETKKNSPLMVIAIVLVAVALISVAAYLIGTKFLSRKPIPTPTPTIVTSPTPTPDVTANWNIYYAKQDLKNIGITFSFKYPVEWFINDEDSSQGNLTPWVVVSKNEVEITSPRTSSGVIITGGIYPETEGVNGVEKQLNSVKLKLSPSTGEVNEITVISSENVTLGEYKGIKRKIKRYDASEETLQVILEGKKNSVYGSGNKNYFILESCPKTDSNIFDQILSTFKFTE